MYDVDLANISGLDLEEALPSDLALALLARGKRFHARKGLIIIAQGSDANDVYLTVSGLVRFSVVSSNGRETILREIGPGRLFGEMAVLGAKRRSASAVVVAPPPGEHTAVGGGGPGLG
jgi:CRP-like cAMP-binding protein